MALSAVYRTAVRAADRYVPNKLRPIWEHPAGPKTVFFWAPGFKWCLVIAGLGDVNRPAEKLSVGQAGALAATGIIWSRYSMVITPKNWSLFSVNLFVAATGLFQLAKIALHRRSLAAQAAAT
ncbi:mitochondrial pyruvate carrier 2-like [Pollicipes pollicipes]|uniref:mitochondrial pyruvate carrier 2-like n=1 Tax=Pollicipes pollicipes TaxID=41117 RepID=UPI001884E888|nr:mitochondrial pyruvate carrier 2-like [Pollicipes pollicipes]XP_037081056.1 mitochondrial pyruvate carrier 2-like [Pollicipes pollicipes]XP_037081057.1 mitochondrial pyruvate carrier 2-like [Pollicipes pollicipes]XP_037081058.1 mitochondrial pyruvate carrier 2-like [Pollicipes pollicipes]